MKRTRDDPSHFLHQSSVYDDDDDSSSSESGEFQPQPLSPPSLPPERKHFCVICDKQFSSGKAYGGHVRIHSSEYNNKGKTKKMKKNKKIGLVRKEKEKEIDLIKADVGKIRCCLCRKEFETMHSLFGHMRRHPDRSWKGIRPPPPEKLKLGFLDDDDEDDDDNVMSRSMTMSDVTEDVQKAACCLMMLNYAAGVRNAAMETSNAEVRICYNDDKGKVKEKIDGEMDDEGLTVDMKIKMEIEVKVNNPQVEAKRSFGFDLNQPYHDQDHPYSYWN